MTKPSERSRVRAATPYLEVETRSISSLQRVIVPREPAQARLWAKTEKREKAHQRWSIRASIAALMLSVLVSVVSVSAAGAETVTRIFTYTGGEQAFVVPAGVSRVNVLAIGGRGGAFEETPGGQAAEVGAEMFVTPRGTLYVEVGSKGRDEMC